MFNILASMFSTGQLFTSLGFTILMIVIMWKVFEKAGYPGIGAIIPIYNIYVEVKMAGYSGLSMLLLLIPLVNVIFGIMIVFKIAERFGKSGLFAVGMILLAPIFWGILAFDDSTYQG